MIGVGPARFPYQLTGGQWLAERERALLGDEMGLGKSVQAIDAADAAGAQNVLVLCKAIGKVNWVREFRKFSPIDRPVQIPSTRDRIADEGLVVINYDIVYRPDVLRQLVNRRWDALICDEMHSLQAGVESKRGEAVLHPQRGLWRTAEAVWGLSGTPALKHSGDLFPWLDALHPDLLERVGCRGRYWSFMDRYTRYSETPFGVRVHGNRNVPELRELLAGVLLRRRRKHVLPDLPPLMVDTLVLQGRNIPELRALEQHPDAMHLRDILDGLDPEENPEAFLRSADFDTASLRRLTGLAKAEALAEQIRDELDGGLDKVVVMGWHREAIDTLADLLDDYGAVKLYGGMSKAAQQHAVDRFQADAQTRVFLGNIQAAGTSITLTAAHRLIFVEASWLPGENEQAMLRVLRIGQAHKCRVSFACLENSVDEAVMSVYARRAAHLSEVFD